MDLDYIASKIPHKTAAQVRDYYYRSLKQIDKLLKDEAFEFDCGDADDARAALIFFHKYQASVYNDLQLNYRDKVQRKQANEWVSNRLISSLNAYKADPVKLVSLVSQDPLIPAKESVSEKLISLDFNDLCDALSSSYSPKTNKFQTTEEYVPFAKRQRLDPSVYGFQEIDDEYFPMCISPAEKLAMQINEPLEDKRLVIRSTPFTSGVFSRSLWDDEMEENVSPKTESCLQDKLNMWVLDHTDEKIINDMGSFWDSMFVH